MPKIGKVETFYTGGGIWISAVYVDESHYYAIDNDYYCDSFCIYDHRGEDQDSDFPCQNAIGFKDITAFCDEEHKLYRRMMNGLKKVGAW